MLGVGLGGCQNDLPVLRVDKPPPPDMQPLIDAYAVPTGTLGPESVAQLAVSVAERVSTTDGLALDRRLIDVARDAVTQFSRTATTAAAPQALADDNLNANAQALTIKGQGYLVVTRICDGWGPAPVAALTNGFIQLTVGFDEQAVDPVIWGTFSLCKYRIGEHVIQLDGREVDRTAGDLRAFIGPGVTLANFATVPNPVLIELVAQATLDNVEVSGHWSARVTVATRALELLVPLVNGNVIVAVDAVRSNLVQVHAANGTFSCDFNALRCVDPSGNQFGAP
jgi:hypothetical protein